MAYPYKNLKEFVHHLEKEGELIRIKAPVDAELEITEIADRISKACCVDGNLANDPEDKNQHSFADTQAKKIGNKALLFENVRGYDMPVLINSLGSHKRMKMALGVYDHRDGISFYLGISCNT
jgi:4-hydroxy-3-polyprenylbenzoate decarboxylase